MSGAISRLGSMSVLNISRYTHTHTHTHLYIYIYSLSHINYISNGLKIVHKDECKNIR